MNWAKAKTLLLLLLLSVNVILGGFLLIGEMQTRTQERAATENLCAALERNGLAAKPEQLPQTSSLTYDVERAKEPVSGEAAVRGLRVVTPVAGQWLWEEALPIDNKVCHSAGYCLLGFTAAWEKSGILEECELVFTAAQIAPDVLRLRPSWRFVISGEEVIVPAS
ncbi:MAG: hypothetical protein FWG31_07100 [Oscillospiraceae bacterium]|nr:hypothetical protein [Oscillospiraceae bacterium]